MTLEEAIAAIPEGYRLSGLYEAEPHNWSGTNRFYATLQPRAGGAHHLVAAGETFLDALLAVLEKERGAKV